MSYAQAAAPHGKEQQEHAHDIPDAVPEIAHSDSGVHSLDSMSSSGNNSVPSYAEQQRAKEQADEAKRQAGEVADEAAEDAKEFTQKSEKELKRLEKEAGKKYEEFSAEAKESYTKWKKEASKDLESAKKNASKAADKGSKKAQDAAHWADENKENPVVVGNAVVLTAGVALLGAGAYRLHQQNALTWKVAGATAGVLGVLAFADYQVSQYFFKKYPPKN